MDNKGELVCIHWRSHGLRESGLTVCGVTSDFENDTLEASQAFPGKANRRCPY
jgi:hypothetical protein